MRKKIGIVTLLGYFNYGNRLQNYALQETIKKFGFEVESLRFTDQPGFLNEPGVVSKKYKINKLKGKNIEEIFTFMTKYSNKMIREFKNKRTNQVRTKIFKDFTQKYINEIDYLGNEENYKYFVVGSDQVWNPHYIVNKPHFLLNFSSPEKKISYAASFGISDLEPYAATAFKKELQNFKCISVREDDGAKIIENLLNVSSKVLVDPTMLLSKSEWLAISSKASNRPKGKYILTYFLGKPPYEAGIEIKKLAKDNNLKIINLGDIDERATYKTGPSEFIDYINNASVFFTDSFHGVVFSIILETPFVVYRRYTAGKSMYSRIETLLDKFNLKNREASGFNESYFEMDFRDAKEVLELEYKRSIEFLSNAFETKLP